MLSIYGKKGALLLAGVLIAISSILTGNAYAIPSYARQTNLPCSSCHYTFPELTPFGRNFKLDGYTLTTRQTISEKASGDQSALNLLKNFLMSAMVQVSYNNVAKPVPGSKTGNFEFPQQMSLFLGGQITPHIGAFTQITYDDQGAAFGWDNTDIRYSNQGFIADHQIVYGVTLNNNPTVEDLWNSTPAWGYPFAASSSAPTPGASTLIDGAFGGNVAGLGAYALYDNLIYADISGYKSTPQGGPFPPDANSQFTISGIAPYWRVALEKQWPNTYAEIGTYGLAVDVYPTGVTGSTDNYTDIALDCQVEQAVGNNELVFHSTWIHENQKLNASFAAGSSQNPTNSLSTFRIDGSYTFDEGLAVMLQYFNTSGSGDNILYAPDPVDGSLTGSPNSSGLTAELAYNAWQNTRLSLQYVMYNKFNGSSSNYDGSGRNASDNNTLYISWWILL
ncbi:MAG: cytochrome C [Bacteroidetes bacterium]|nr:cytochrome C [Bacteroidota bacterium]